MDDLITYIEKGQTERFIKYFNKNSFADPFMKVFREDPKTGITFWHSLFDFACQYGRLEICKYLVSEGRGPAESQLGFCLSQALLYNHFHVADWLQEEFNIDCSISSSWPLTMSARYGNLPGVKYALEHNANIHARNDYALRYAAYNGHLEVVEYLISKGADIHALGESALKEAVKEEHFDIAGLLLGHGADPSVLSPEQLETLQPYLKKLDEKPDSPNCELLLNRLLEEARELQNEVGCLKGSIENEVGCLKGSIEKIESRIAHLLEELGASRKTEESAPPEKVSKNSKRESYTPKDIMKKTGLSYEGARSRLRKWEAGKISTEELFAPPRR